MKASAYIFLILLLLIPLAGFAGGSCAIESPIASTCSKPDNHSEFEKSSSSQTSEKSREQHYGKLAIPSNARKITIDLFYSYDCPHCHDALAWLPEINKFFPNVVIRTHEVKKNLENRKLFEEMAQKHNERVSGVPTFFIENRVFVGFYKDQTCCKILDEIKTLTFGEDNTHNKGIIKLPFIGEIEVENYSLLSFSVIVGLLDGFNPCAMWVLMFLMGLMVYTRSKRRILAVGGIFIAASATVYFAFMSAWFNFFSIIGYSQIFRILLALAAIIMGLINLKELFFFKQGVSLMITDSAKTKIAEKIRKIMQEKSTAAVVLSTILLAIFVNLIELGCTIGLPAIFTKILAERDVSVGSKYFYMIVYNLAYVLPLMLIVLLFVVTLGRYKMTEKQGKVLKFISGALMFLLGLAMLIKPELLTMR